MKKILEWHISFTEKKRIAYGLSYYQINDSLFEWGDFNLKFMILLLMIKQWLPESLPELSYKTTHNNRSLKA